MTNRTHVQAIDNLRSTAFSLLKTDPSVIPTKGRPSLSVPVLTCASQQLVRAHDAQLAETKLTEAETLILNNIDNEKYFPISEISRLNSPAPHYWSNMSPVINTSVKGVRFKKSVENSVETTWIHDGSPFLRIIDQAGVKKSIRWEYVESYEYVAE